MQAIDPVARRGERLLPCQLVADGSIRLDLVAVHEFTGMIQASRARKDAIAK